MKEYIEIFGYVCFSIAILLATFYPAYILYKQDKKKKANDHPLKIGGCAKLM